MITEINASKFLLNFYKEKKILIDFIGFLGLVSALFLQIPFSDNGDLKKIQAILISIFAIFITYLLIVFWLLLVAFVKTSPKVKIINSLLISYSIVIFLYYLFKFIIGTFQNELLVLLPWFKLGLLFLFCSYMNDFLGKVAANWKHRELVILIREVLWIVCLFVFLNLPFSNSNFDFIKSNLPFIGLIYFGILLVNIVRAYKWITARAFYVISFLIFVAVTLYWVAINRITY